MSRLSDLDALVQLSEHMLAKAQAGDWEGMDELVSQRLSFLQITLALQSSVAEAAEIKARLERIVALDQELTTLAIAAREESAAAFRRLRNGQSAHTAYANVDRS